MAWLVAIAVTVMRRSPDEPADEKGKDRAEDWPKGLVVAATGDRSIRLLLRRRHRKPRAVGV